MRHVVMSRSESANSGGVAYAVGDTPRLGLLPAYIVIGQLESIELMSPRDSPFNASQFASAKGYVLVVIYTEYT